MSRTLHQCVPLAVCMEIYVRECRERCLEVHAQHLWISLSSASVLLKHLRKPHLISASAAKKFNYNHRAPRCVGGCEASEMTVCQELRGPGGIESITHVVHIKRGREGDSCVECSFVQAEMKTGELTGAALSPQSAVSCEEMWGALGWLV